MSSYEMPEITGISTTLERKIARKAWNLKIENTTMLTTMTNSRKLVPQRGCSVECGRAFSTVSSSPASQV